MYPRHKSDRFRTKWRNIFIIYSICFWCLGSVNDCPWNVFSAVNSERGHMERYGKRCYERVPQRRTWDEANADCRRKGGYLVQIGSSQEEAAIGQFLSHVDSQHAVWIGLHDQGHEETFTWTSGETNVTCSFGKKLSYVMRKPVFGFCNQVRLKPACSATDSSKSLGILDIESVRTILSMQRKIQALIRLRGCAFVVSIYGINRFSQNLAQII